MARPAKKPRGGKAKGTSKTPRRTVARGGSAPRTLSQQQAAEQFVKGVVTRGEACEPNDQGQLPSGCTHEIVSQEPGKLPEIRRRRFSIT
jgi:hypothetical protein